MADKIINLEINEISPTLFEEYIKRNKSCNLTKLFNKEMLQIYTTKALDIPKNKLYPSQTWASFNTGKPYSEHKCYWYSDNLNSNDLIWNKLASKNKSVGILGSIHSSKFPNDLYLNQNYKFYLPDCFTDEDKTKPISYRSFQSLNNSLVSGSSRVTGVKNLLKNLSKHIYNILFFPKKYGISFFSIKMILYIIYLSFSYKNKEIIRMAQFPLIASIFTDLFIKYQPSYSTLFSNHVAGNMHRYWYAYDLNSFKEKKKYSKEWIKKNKNIIFASIDLIDNFIGHILTKREFKESVILITSSMGQEANPNFDDKFLSKYDGKIKEMKFFLDRFYSFFYEKYQEKIEFICYRNMAPQYGFKIKHKTNINISVVVKSISDFVSGLGFKNKVDEESGSIVLSLDPYTDINLQKSYNLNEVNEKFNKYGFDFFPITDHHSGSHSEDGSLIAINSNYKLNKKIDKYIEKDGYINYLNFFKCINEFFEK